MFVTVIVDIACVSPPKQVFLLEKKNEMRSLVLLKTIGTRVTHLYKRVSLFIVDAFGIFIFEK